MNRPAVSLRSRPTRLRYIVLAAVLLLASGVVAAGLSGSTATLAAAPAACEVDPATPKRQFRAMWIASVANLDWPSRTGLSVAAQRPSSGPGWIWRRRTTSTR